MDMSLKSESERLDLVIGDFIKATQNQFDENEKRLANICTELREMEKTDASENAPLQIKRDEQAMCSALSVLLGKRIKSMSSEVGNYVPTGFIQLGTTVEVSLVSVPQGVPVEVGRKFIFKIVQHDTSLMEKQLMAIDTKLGSALLTRTEGDTVEITAPGGKFKYKVERIY